MFFLYNILFIILGPIVLIPYYVYNRFKGKYKNSLGPKLGLVPPGLTDLKGSPRIWVHAVSVGEVTAAAPIIMILRMRMPGACILVSTSTETGQEMARKVMSGVSAFLYFPLDFPFAIRKVLRSMRPDVFAAVETEIWPNFIRLSKKLGTEIVLVNARISPRSYKRYFKTRWFWKRVLGMIGSIGAISEVDADRLKSIGAAESKIIIFGNAKFDGLAARVDDQLKKEIGGKLQIAPDSRVFVAGSTHEGEEKIVLDVYSELLKEYPDLLLVLVPRHPERGEAVAQMAVDAGVGDYMTMSKILSGEKRTSERIVIIDVIGELFKAYSLASFVFCGGSLVPRGGQNILEPAAWGKVVFYGPFMEDFQGERGLLEEVGCGITVHNSKDLLDNIKELLIHPEQARSRGEAGRSAIAASKGASEKYASMIIEAVKRKK